MDCPKHYHHRCPWSKEKGKSCRVSTKVQGTGYRWWIVNHEREGLTKSAAQASSAEIPAHEVLNAGLDQSVVFNLVSAEPQVICELLSRRSTERQKWKAPLIFAVFPLESQQTDAEDHYTRRFLLSGTRGNVNDCMQWKILWHWKRVHKTLRKSIHQYGNNKKKKKWNSTCQLFNIFLASGKKVLSKLFPFYPHHSSQK